ncbi:RNA polymerase II-specific transcription factor-like protein [Microdochium nivale]|nr:RNA polymerase II-specific transcription factor-like protein [Microdochium nivale]
MIHVQPDRPCQLRRACDRCHKSKLRCIRLDDDDGHDGHDACQRCQHAAAECITSPASRPQRHRLGSSTTTRLNPKSHSQPARPSHDHSTSTSTSTGAGTDQVLSTCLDGLPDFQDPAFNLNLFLLGVGDTDMDMAIADAPPLSPHHGSITTSSSSTVSSSAPSSVHPSSSLPPVPDTGPLPKPIDYYMRKISDVGLVLMQHLQAIPLVSPGDDSPVQLLATATTTPGAPPTCPIDQVFHLSDVFIETLDDVLARLPPPFTGEPFDPGLAADRLSLDAASELLIFSTYLRLVETYDRILQHIQLHCQQRSSSNRSSLHQPASTHAAAPDQPASSPAIAAATSSRNDNAPAAFQVNLPGWSIGTFYLSAQSKTQQLFMIHLIETMLVRASELVMSDVVSRRATLGYRGNWECFGGLSLSIVPDLALQAVRTRDKVVMKRVADIKSALR